MARIETASVARAFVAGLRPRRFEHWSTLASFAIARSLPEHDFARGSDARRCRVCGAVSRLVAFESDHFAKARQAGVVRSDSLRYVLHDLETFAGETYAEPGEPDRVFFDRAVAGIANLPRDSNTFAAEKNVGALFHSRIERKLLLGILGVCGILDSPVRPGFFPDFVAFEDRAKLDSTPYTYPVTWWRREYGVKLEALRTFGLDGYLKPDTLRAIA